MGKGVERIVWDGIARWVGLGFEEPLLCQLPVQFWGSRMSVGMVADAKSS
jgi:hypothetical protein